MRSSSDSVTTWSKRSVVGAEGGELYDWCWLTALETRLEATRHRYYECQRPARALATAFNGAGKARSLAAEMSSLRRTGCIRLTAEATQGEYRERLQEVT